MSGHQHLGGPHLTQNQGNVLGDRPCVKQSRLYRELVSGNNMKAIMGQEDLSWQTDRQEGAYAGRPVHGEGTTSAPTSAPYAGGIGGARLRQEEVSVPPQRSDMGQQARPTRAVPQQSTAAPWATDDQAPQDSVARQGKRSFQQQSGGVPWATDASVAPAQGPSHRRGAGAANRQGYNIIAHD